MKILLPVDGSDYTRRTLEYVDAHRDIFGAVTERRVLTVVPPLPPQVTRFVAPGLVEDYYRDRAEEVLEPVRAFAARREWTLEASYRVGHAAEVIAAVAKAERPHLIVMGTHGHGVLGNVLLGSVANGVLCRCRTPVLLVR